MRAQRLEVAEDRHGRLILLQDVAGRARAEQAERGMRRDGEREERGKRERKGERTEVLRRLKDELEGRKEENFASRSKRRSFDLFTRLPTK